MTADQVKGKGFRGALRYNLQKVDQGVAKVMDSSFAILEENAVMKELQLVKMLRPNLAKYFYHTSLNFPPNENLDDEQMNKIANQYLNNMGFVQNQYMIFRHFDADHPHVHLLVNRIGYDGSVVSDSKDYQRSEQVLRQLEKQHGLTEVISSRQAQERAMTKNELEMMKRTDEPSTKMKLQVILKSILEQKSKPNTMQFIAQLEAKGINVLFNQASTGFVSGISYSYAGLQFKGAHLGNAYKWQAIKTAISYEQEKDRTAIYEANVSTRAQQSARAAAGTAGTRVRPGQTDADPATRSISTSQRGIPSKDRKADRGDSNEVKRTGQDRKPSRLSDQINRESGRKHQQGEQPGRQQVDHQNLPDRDLIGSLLGPDHHADHLDGDPLKLKQRKKKRKGLRL
ncbi:relaxase/mobilization nuclease domain-containing protein [Mucilaginibacter sp. 14171R-50]|uniref:relaxase/mobilization nuclease domain-containing protein n=1 Tax=Mucilaginibacter sp. 14171R-50 TaxID=2703789 RepID=UPI00138C0D2B|nr:relaxase/mobilization nuclease domain-containing protein [Mucilaginibacter sp. 14171R-50]QHS56813.1 relaxase/mobilization nuclease domain-containing protein [Mucilaginibacter sp. 14171R-50]